MKENSSTQTALPTKDSKVFSKHTEEYNTHTTAKCLGSLLGHRLNGFVK
jgi:hypothetical protein